MGRTYLATKDAMEEIMINKSDTADEVIILAGKGKFLVDGGGNDSRQFMEIVKNAHKYKILLNSTTRNKESNSIINALEGAGVLVGILSEGSVSENIRGRLLRVRNKFSAVFCSKVMYGNFDMLDLEDDSLAKLLFYFFIGIVKECGLSENSDNIQ